MQYKTYDINIKDYDDIYNNYKNGNFIKSKAMRREIYKYMDLKARGDDKSYEIPQSDQIFKKKNKKITSTTKKIRYFFLNVFFQIKLAFGVINKQEFLSAATAVQEAYWKMMVIHSSELTTDKKKAICIMLNSNLEELERKAKSRNEIKGLENHITENNKRVSNILTEMEEKKLKIDKLKEMLNKRVELAAVCQRESSEYVKVMHDIKAIEDNLLKVELELFELNKESSRKITENRMLTEQKGNLNLMLNNPNQFAPKRNSVSAA